MIQTLFRYFSHTSEHTQMVLRLIKSSPVVMFSKTSCPYCMEAKATLKVMQVQPKVIEVDKEKEGDSMKSALKELTMQNTVPNIFIGGFHIGGYDDLSEGLASGAVQERLKESNVEFKDIK
ncbi:unnamed protein product [Blepharisma stoltei]|uniref:Glutaredoxin domain-containing protein n=1 Tax=Blepharisma stoltei TaxID=1481888 RepID=A0AAU9K9F1_9CILI|nr:unnamed protein product [Blepharisma stoltei]